MTLKEFEIKYKEFLDNKNSSVNLIKNIINKNELFFLNEELITQMNKGYSFFTETLVYSIYKNNINAIEIVYPFVNNNNEYIQEIFLLKCIKYNCYDGFKFLHLKGFKLKDEHLNKSFEFLHYDIVKYILDHIDIENRLSYKYISRRDFIINCCSYCFIYNNSSNSKTNIEWIPEKCSEKCKELSKLNLYRLAYYTDKKYDTNYKYLNLVKKYGAIVDEYCLIYNTDISGIDYSREYYNYEYSNETFFILLLYYSQYPFNKEFKDSNIKFFINYIYKTDKNHRIKWNSKLLNSAILHNCQPLVEFLVNTIKIKYNCYEFNLKNCNIDIVLLILSKVNPYESPLLNMSFSNYNINQLLRHINLDDSGFRQLIYENTTNMHPKLRKRCIRKLNRIKIRNNILTDLLKNIVPIAEDVIRYIICTYI